MVRFIVLSVFNHSELYDAFKNENMAYLKVFKKCRPAMSANIRFYYVIADPDAVNDVTINESENLITVRGVESWCPGILTKTIHTLTYLNDASKYDFKYDYIIRTNTSSFVNLEGFYNELTAFGLAHKSNVPEYKYVTMGSDYTADGNNETYGLNDQTMQLYRGTQFPHGVCIVMNAALVSLICDETHRTSGINYSVVDDVEFGRILETLARSPHSCPNGIYKHDLKGRILFMGNAHDPLVYCNNRFKANRSIDLHNFSDISARFIRALIQPIF